MKFLIILIFNILYVVMLTQHPASELYHIYDRIDVIQYYTDNISKDTGSYYFMPDKGMLRTVGYPFVLHLFMRMGIIWMLLFNCILGAWLFQVTFNLIGHKAWLLAGLGAFTAHVPILYSDLLFATLFVTSIWMIRKNLYIHFLLLGVAALVRPSLAWFFLIEPIVLCFNGYTKKMAILSLPIVFIVTAFNPIRNYVNHRQWTHSTVLEFNKKSDMYYGGAESKPQYIIQAFKANALSGHYDFIGAMFNKYKRDLGDKQASTLMYYLNVICVLINVMIWVRFSVRVLQNKVNWGYVLILAYFIIPTLFGAAGSRLRLPVEWILLI